MAKFNFTAYFARLILIISLNFNICRVYRGCKMLLILTVMITIYADSLGALAPNLYLVALDEISSTILTAIANYNIELRPLPSVQT